MKKILIIIIIIVCIVFIGFGLILINKNRKVDYKFVKTLSQEQLNSLKSKLQITSNT